MKLYKVYLACLFILAFASCGGGGSSDSEPSATPPVVTPPANEAPTAVVISTLSAPSSSEVVLDGSASVDDSAIDTFLWQQTEGDTVVLNDSASSIASFTAPTLAAGESTQLTFSLTVIDAEGESDTATVVVTVTNNEPVAVAPETLTGLATFDLVPLSATNALDYDNTIQAPIRGARVELLESNSVVQTTTTNASGEYRFESVAAPGNYTVRVRAELKKDDVAPTWDFTVVDNTNGQALYTMQANIDFTNDNSVLNLNAPSGWTGSSYTEPRVAGPFAILNSVYQALQTVVGVDEDVIFPALKLNWSVNNVAVSGNSSIGQIGTSFFDGSEIFLLGAANSDTDEYDDHVVIHEWGHYFEGQLSRSDSIGGLHSGGDLLDLRVALGEGFGNALSGMVTLDPFYRDSFGNAQANGFFINVEQANNNRGSYSEAAVQSILYDIFDDEQDTTEDTLSLGFGPIYEALIGQEVSTNAFTSIYTLMAAIKSQSPESESELNTLAESFNIVLNDDFGTGETNDGGDSRNLPIYKQLVVNGAPTEICSFSTNGTFNKLGNNQYLRFSINTNGNYQFTAIAQTSGDVDFSVYRQGQRLFTSEATGNESRSQTLASGEYVMEAYHFGNRSGANTADLCFDIAISTN
ncbi:carboxypeptidase regulatory-like domain-containing protein [Alteromonas sp. 5E99-2]|uniref:PKD domain-containing protein n=1 Tax=Alteromonas sp. 5E99-2 TaxID=2817683 RepID=UPI001A9A049D|nr:carboxypeptidase regulatory-like domain-containing protein [Alteromonas sp. 5E99-2]MBO1256164.1 carboxypeptidase regulatory-like domain-containing protein [Alteromonas sp. 5E99-2]